MKSEQIHRHFKNIKTQRTTFYSDMGISADEAWKRPNPEKWSVGETVYHLFLLARLLRRFSVFYIPITLPVAHLRKKRPYKTELHDIYQEYREEKQKPMPAPFLLKPPADLAEKWPFQEVQTLLENETDKLKKQLDNIEENIAGQIYFPDPIAHYPNLIQSVHLLGIHEEHHFRIVRSYVYE